jgi:hypothetical protein
LEEIAVAKIVRLRVSARRGRLSRRLVHAMEVQVERRISFQLMAGYPQQTLDELCDLLAAELGLVPRTSVAVETSDVDG